MNNKFTISIKWLGFSILTLVFFILIKLRLIFLSAKYIYSNESIFSLLFNRSILGVFILVVSFTILMIIPAILAKMCPKNKIGKYIFCSIAFSQFLVTSYYLWDNFSNVSSYGFLVFSNIFILATFLLPVLMYFVQIEEN